jgi:purine nucleosidase
VAAALDRSLIRTEALTVDVELGGTLTTGETVTDWRRVWGRPPNVDVAVDGDADTFIERFVERVGMLAAARVDVAR